ncbi:MAG: DUF4870 domain-containing protein [Cyclobacteriaceae bacterium]|nr:DUF4870 domain-containing protein [Cyclobacteriaceae bacterium]
MISTNAFTYKPNEHEAEKASSSYLMSLVALMAGLPIPIINLFATMFFYLANRKGTYYVRWHTTQALLSQLSLVFINSYGFWWTVSIVFGSESVSNNYISYLIIVLIFNLTEFVATIYSAVQTRKGMHIHWWLYGDLTDIICKPGNGQNNI